MSDQLVATFAEPASVEPAIVGGKGANLGRLAGAGFPVPGGFTVTTVGHTAALAAGLGEQIGEICAGLDYADADALERSTAEIRERVLADPLPDEVADAVRAAYAELGDEAYVAVRSSGTAEDLADASFAGLHDTFLDVRGAEAVLSAVRGCWASMWTARATAYRHERGFDHGEARLAVVVQLMVESEVAGVMFTGNPLTAATDEIVVNSAFGLGESVVGGTVTPDVFVVHLDDLRILERTPGTKATRIVRDPDAAHGTVTEPLPDAQQQALSLSDEDVASLGKLGRRVQNHYGGFPQDIEWAMAGGEFFLLQSRPITGVPFAWDADLEDTNINSQVDDDWVWTRVFADTVCTGGITPLNYSARFTRGMTLCWNHIAKCAGIDELQDMRVWKYYRGELYYNCEWERIWLERMTLPAARTPPAMAMVPDSWHADIAAAPFSKLGYAKGLLTTQMVDPRVFAFKKMMTEWRTDRRDEVVGLSPQELTHLSDRELKRYIAKQFDVEVDYGAPVVMMLLAHMAGLMTSFMLLLIKWYDGGDPIAAFTQLISGSRERTDTQIENHKLWELAQLIRGSEEVLALFREHEGAAFFEACERSEAGRAFLAEYRPFEVQYGHRGHADRDVYYKRRAEEPGRDYPAFKALLSVADPVDPIVQENEVNERREATFAAVLENVREKPLGILKAEALKIMYTVMHDYIVMRDNERQFPNDAVILSWKRGLVEVGRRLTERGVLAEQEDVYYLSEPEAYELLDGHTRNLRLYMTKLEARRRDFQRRVSGEATMPKYIQRNRPVNLDTPINQSPEDGVFAGMPTSPGTVTGRARIIRTLGEIGQVEEHDILITNSTDPGWTPVFLVISGVVVETGGMLSHASCLAREYGFPAVQVEGATALINDGATVRLDGDAGTVTVVDAASEAETLAAAQAPSVE